MFIEQQEATAAEELTEAPVVEEQVVTEDTATINNSEEVVQVDEEIVPIDEQVVPETADATAITNEAEQTEAVAPSEEVPQ